MSNRLKLLREKATRPRRTVPVLLDGEVREQIEAVEDELDRLDSAPASNDRRLSTKTNDAEREQLVADLDALYESAEQSTLYVVLEAMQRTPYRALIAAHPARLDAEGKPLPADRFGWNSETLAEPLVRACIVGYRERPEVDAEVLPMPAEDVDKLMAFVTERQLDALAAAALRLCAGDDAVPLRRKRSATPTSDGE